MTRQRVVATVCSWVMAACLAPALCAAARAADAPSHLYKAMFVRAAPGRLLDLVALYLERMPVYDAAGDERPFWWRHTQGDHWDLMFLFPMGSYTEYFAAERVARRSRAADASGVPQAQFARRFYECSAWHEDLYVNGPPLETVKNAFRDTSYYHIEIFVALPGKQEELRKEREMENAYQKALGRPETLIFTHDQGAAWDLFSLGCYRDLKHWAESADIPKEKRDAAARAAGFADAGRIGIYMRTLIDMHRDTMGVAIK